MLGFLTLHIINSYGCRLKICRLSATLLASLFILADPLSTMSVAFGLMKLDVDDSVSPNKTSDLSSLFFDLITNDEFFDGFFIKVVLVLLALISGYYKGANIFMIVLSLTGLLETAFITQYIYSTILAGDLYTCKPHLLNETYSNTK